MTLNTGLDYMDRVMTMTVTMTMTMNLSQAKL